MTRPDWIPFADRKPSPNGGYAANPVLMPLAIVPHSAHAPLNSDPPRRFYETEVGWWGSPGCTHLWIYGDGSLTQLVKLSKPAWGNGWLNRPDGKNSSKILVRGWYERNRNPNYDTISCEFAGYGLQAPNTSVASGPSIPPTDEQMDTWFLVTNWMLAEGWLDSFVGQELSEQTIILHREITETACPDGRFDSEYMLEGATPTPETSLPPPVNESATETFEEYVNRTLSEHGNYLSALNDAAWEHKSGSARGQHNQPRPD